MLGDMLNGLTSTNCHIECMTPKDASRSYFFHNKKINSLAIVVRSVKAKIMQKILNIIFL